MKRLQSILSLALVGLFCSSAVAQTEPQAQPQPQPQPQAQPQPQQQPVAPTYPEPAAQPQPPAQPPAAPPPAPAANGSYQQWERAPGGSAPRERPPSGGVGLRVAGWIVLGIGVANLVTSPICLLDAYQDSGVTGLCLGLSFGVGAAGLAVGIPLLAVGYSKRAKLIKWREQNGYAKHLLRSRIIARRDGLMLGYGLTF